MKPMRLDSEFGLFDVDSVDTNASHMARFNTARHDEFEVEYTWVSHLFDGVVALLKVLQAPFIPGCVAKSIALVTQCLLSQIDILDVRM